MICVWSLLKKYHSFWMVAEVFHVLWKSISAPKIESYLNKLYRKSDHYQPCLIFFADNNIHSCKVLMPVLYIYLNQ